MNWEHFDRFVKLVKYHNWKFASTMPKHPHYYSLRKKWNNDNGFDFAVNFIREYGYGYKFYGRMYTRFDLDEYSYWSMDGSVSETTLINRALTGDKSPYDKIAESYETLFVSEASKLENNIVFDLIGDVTNKSVLDVGCGTGLFRDYATPKDYTGIDCSRTMLEVMKSKHPDAKTINTCLRSFSGGKFDIGVALFGTASYLTKLELTRLSTMCDRLVLMFYANDYVPVTYKETGVYIKHIKYDLHKENVRRVGNFSVVDKEF